MEEEEWDDDFVVAPIAAEVPKQLVVQEEVLVLPVVHNGLGEEKEATSPPYSPPVEGTNQEIEKEKIFVEMEESTAVTTQDQILSLEEHDDFEIASNTPVITPTTMQIPNALPDSLEISNDIMSSETIIKIDVKTTAPEEVNKASMMPESDSIHNGKDSEAIMESLKNPHLGTEKVTEIIRNNEMDSDDNAILMTSQSATDDSYIDKLKVEEQDDAVAKLVDVSSAAKTPIDEGITADSILPSNTSCDDDTANSLVEAEQWDGDVDFVTAATPTMPIVICDTGEFDDKLQSLSLPATTPENGVDLPVPQEHDHAVKQEEEAVVVNNSEIEEEDDDEWADFEGPVTAPPPITTTVATDAAEVPEADLADDRPVEVASISSSAAAPVSTTINSPPAEHQAAIAIKTFQASTSAVMHSAKMAQELEVLRDVLGDRVSLYANLREKCGMVFGEYPPLVSVPIDKKLPWDTVAAATAQAPTGTHAVDEGHCTSYWSREQIQHAVMTTIPADAIKINPRYDGLWLWVSNAKSHFVPVSAVPLTHAASSSALHAKPSPPVHVTNPSPLKSLGQNDKGASPIPTMTRETIARPSSPPQSPPYSPPSSPRQKIQLPPSSQTRPIDANTDKGLGIGEWDIGEGKEVIPPPLPSRPIPPTTSLPSSGTSSSSSSSSLSSSATAGMRKLFSSFGSLPAGDTKKPPSVTSTSTSSGRSIEGIGYDNDVASNHTNASARSSSSSSLSPLPLNREVAGPSPNVVAISATTDAFEDFDALFGGSDTTTTMTATESIATMSRSGGIDPNFFMFEPEISPAVTSFLQTLPDFSYVLKS